MEFEECFGCGRLSVDTRAMILWKKVECEEDGIENKNWLALKYNKSRNKLELVGSGEKGLEESKIQLKDEIAFIVSLGCHVRRKKPQELVRLVLLWIPKNIDPSFKAQAIMDVDAIIKQLEIECFYLLRADSKEMVSRESIISQVNKIRGDGTIQGRYFFDENVTRLRKESIEKLLDQCSSQKVLENRRKEAHILRELFSTERHYFNCMKILQEKFVEPIKIHGYTKVHTFVSSMVNIIVCVNRDYYSSLQNEYNITSEICNDEKEFTRRLNELDESFFTPSKISSIVDISQRHFKTFQFYGPYVCNYQRMMKSVGFLLSEDEKLLNHFNESKSELRRSNHRNVDFPSFLIQPIQRIPRYELLFRELRRSTLKNVNPELHLKITTTEDLIRNIAKLVNKNKEDEMKSTKTIELSKKLQRPDLMDERMIKYRTIEILDRKKLLKNKNKKNVITKGRVGEIIVFEQSLFIVKLKKEKTGFLSYKNKKNDEYDKEEKYQMKLYYEVNLRNPNVRCNRHTEHLSILEVEDENRIVSMKVVNGESVCEELVLLIQHQLSKFLGHRAMKSLFSTRIVFKSWLSSFKTTTTTTNNNNNNNRKTREKRHFHVFSANMKIKVYETEEIDENWYYYDIDPIHSYSLIGVGKYGITSISLPSDDDDGKYHDSSTTKISSPFRSTIDDQILDEKNGHIEEEEEEDWCFDYYKNNGKRNHSCYEINSMREEEEEEDLWFYIMYIISEDGKSEKRKKKVFFRAEDRKEFDIWMLILDRNIGKGKRCDEKEHINNLEEDENEEEEEEIVQVDGYNVLGKGMGNFVQHREFANRGGYSFKREDFVESQRREEEEEESIF